MERRRLAAVLAALAIAAGIAVVVMRGRDGGERARATDGTPPPVPGSATAGAPPGANHVDDHAHAADARTVEGVRASIQPPPPPALAEDDSSAAAAAEAEAEAEARLSPTMLVAKRERGLIILDESRRRVAAQLEEARRGGEPDLVKLLEAKLERLEATRAKRAAELDELLRNAGDAGP